MKNVTVSLSDEVYQRARVKAAHAGRSLSSMVREYLESVGTEETEFERLKRMEHELRARQAAEGRGRGLSPAKFMTREEIYNERFDR